MTRDLTETERLFLALDGDIRDRKGIGNEWEQIDSDVMLGEIKPVWEKIIAAALSAAHAAGAAAMREAAWKVCQDKIEYLKKWNIRQIKPVAECADAIAALIPPEPAPSGENIP